MKHLLALSLCATCAACSAATSPEQATATPAPPSAAMDAPAAKAAPYRADLAWMLERVAPLEVEGRPCLLKPAVKAPWVGDPGVRTRLREVRSDSLWLGRWAREKLADRLAYAEVTYDLPGGFTNAPPDSPPQLIYEIGVTGSQRISPPPLGGRAKDVPVVVRYDQPVSFDEFMARREAGHAATRDLVNRIGEGGSPSPHGLYYVRMDTFSEDGKPDAKALAQCDALRRAYRLPVLMEFLNARIYEGMGQP